jgi:hypothetical protein
LTEFLDFAARHPFMATLWVWSGMLAVCGFRPLMLFGYVRRRRNCGCKCDESSESAE